MERQVSMTPSLLQDDMILPRQQNHQDANQGTTIIIPPALRRTILRILSRKYGMQLHSSAISFIHSTLQSHGLLEDPNEWDEAIEWLAKGLVESAGKGEQGALQSRVL